MPLDPGGGGYTSYPTSNARSIRRNPVTGQTAFVPYDYHYSGGPGVASRVLSGINDVFNPVMAAERFMRFYRQQQEAGSAYQQMAPSQRAAYNTAALHPPAPSWQESFGIPTKPEDIGAALAALIPVKVRDLGTDIPYPGLPRAGETAVDVNTYKGPPEPNHVFRSLEELRRYMDKGPLYLNWRGMSEHLAPGNKATIARAPQGQIVASSNWQDPFSTGARADEFNANDIYIHPALEGNLNLFQALVRGPLKDSIRSQKAMGMFFANPELMTTAIRALARQGFRAEPGMLPGDYRFLPPTYRERPWSVGY